MTCFKKISELLFITSGKSIEVEDIEKIIKIYKCLVTREEASTQASPMPPLELSISRKPSLHQDSLVISPVVSVVSSEIVEPPPSPVNLVFEYEFKSDDWWKNSGFTDGKTSRCFIRKLEHPEAWMSWVEESESNAHKLIKLGYVKLFAPHTKGMTSQDKDKAIEMIEKLNLDIKNGRASRTSEKLEAKAKDISEKAKGIIELSFTKPITRFNVFGAHLPPSRTGDVQVFKVFDNEKEAEKAESKNHYLKDTATITFTQYKNKKDWGNQTYSLIDSTFFDGFVSAEKLAEVKTFLDSFNNGEELINLHYDNPSKILKAKNKVSTNEYRHYWETHVATKLNVEQRKMLRGWLCHSASAAETYYIDE